MINHDLPVHVPGNTITRNIYLVEGDIHARVTIKGQTVIP